MVGGLVALVALRLRVCLLSTDEPSPPPTRVYIPFHPTNKTGLENSSIIRKSELTQCLCNHRRQSSSWNLANALFRNGQKLSETAAKRIDATRDVVHYEGGSGTSWKAPEHLKADATKLSPKQGSTFKQPLSCVLRVFFRLQVQRSSFGLEKNTLLHITEKKEKKKIMTQKRL